MGGKGSGRRASAIDLDFAKLDVSDPAAVAKFYSALTKAQIANRLTALAARELRLTFESFVKASKAAAFARARQEWREARE